MGMIYLQNGGLSIGTMFLVYYYTTILLIPLRNLVNEASDLQQANASLQRIGQLWTDSGEIIRYGEDQLVGTDLSVRFDQVSYSYDGVNDVLDKVSFHLPAGKTLGIVGKTGSGKTSVTRLLFRLCEVREGAVSINGIEVREIDLTRLRKSIAFISQNVELFEGTLKDNITMFKEGIADSEILRIFEAMSISSWLYAHPDGLSRFIERDGSNVSAGEAQLIALARAFLKKPGIVIMDEAVSRMDPLTEKLVHQALDTFLQGRTAIIIAHRLSSVGKADYILTLHNGRVIEFGETKRLVQDPDSEYTKMLKKGSEAHA
jgi:ABC-type multidrug transport system fused ATPase/permease subunit